MHGVYLLCVCMMVFSAMALLGCVMLTRRSRRLGGRLQQLQAQQSPAAHRDWVAAFAEMVAGIAARFGVEQRADSSGMLWKAGFQAQNAHSIYLALKFGGPVLGALAALLLPGNRFLGMTVGMGVFYLGPDMVMKRLAKRRLERIRRSVPDTVDLLVICVDAGLGIDQAIIKVIQELGTSHPDVCGEFQQIMREQRAGKLRLDAWKSLAQRCQVPEIDGFVNMLIQTDRFGTPISKALSAYGDGLRLKRRQRAEELAAKTTVKIIFPLVLFIFPSLFIVVLGPAAIAISRGMSGLNQ